MSRDSFPLPELGAKLAAVSHDLHNGRGFSVIRGLDPAAYSVEDITTIWLGLQAYIADQPGRQDHKGNVLGSWDPLPSPARSRAVANCFCSAHRRGQVFSAEIGPS